MAILEPPILTQEQAVEIRVLKRQGWIIRAIARETGLSRVTVQGLSGRRRPRKLP
jgi:transposase